MMNRGYRELLLCAGAAGIMAAVSSPAAAQTRVFNVPAQEAVTGIPAFARQAGMQILVADRLARGRRTRAVVGALEPDAALAQLLAGTGLAPATREGRTVTLAAVPQDSSAAGSAAPEAVDELVVTGSRLKDQPAGPTPVNTYGSHTIRQSGQVRLETFLNSLPEVSVMSAGNAWTRYGASSTVRLRGLPDGSTAVLLDGRRTAASGLNIAADFDLGSIPVAVIDRVDIVPIGSSAIYGSDAIGGVVNVVLKRRFSGFDGSVSYSGAKQHQERDASVAVGKVWEHAALSLVAAYHDGDGLYAADRKLTASDDFTRFAALGGTDWRTPYCRPGNVSAVSGVLNGLGTATAAIPATGANVVSNYTAGGQNLCSYYAGTPLVTPIRRGSVLLSGEVDLGAGATLYGSVLGSLVRNDTRSADRGVFGVIVPASNPFNPFGQDVQVTTAVPYTAGTMLKTQTLRPLVGVRGDLGRGWDYDLSAWATFVHDDAVDIADSGVTGRLPALLARTDPATAFNLFDVGSNSPALIASAVPLIDPSSHGEAENLSGVVRGHLLTLPAGPVSTAFGFELRRESYNRRDYNDLTPVTGDGSREVWAVFGEGAVPLLGDGTAAPRLEATLAGRYDHYSDFGGKFTPELGLQARVADGLRLGATYSRSFKAPGLTYLSFPRYTFANSTGLYDPVRGESYPITLYTGGTPGLKPETGTAKALTAVWDSVRFTGLHAGATYWRIGEDNRISNLGYQTIINYEDMFADRIVRAPSTDGTPGRILSIDNTFTNFGSLRATGVDLNLRYDWSTDLGVIAPSVALTRTLTYKSQLQPGQPYVDRLSQASSSDAWAPRWKATVGVGWTQDGASALLQGRYVGRYQDYQPPANTNRLGNDWYVDASVETPLARFSGWSGAQHSYIRVSATNLLNRLPRYSNFNSGIVGYDPLEADIVGRLVTVTLGARF